GANNVEIPLLKMAAPVLYSPSPEIDRVRFNMIGNGKLVESVPLHSMVIVMAQHAENHELPELIEVKAGIEPVIFLAAFAWMVNSPRGPVNNLVIYQAEILLDNPLPVTPVGCRVVDTDVESVDQVVCIVSFQFSPVAQYSFGEVMAWPFILSNLDSIFSAISNLIHGHVFQRQHHSQPARA